MSETPAERRARLFELYGKNLAFLEVAAPGLFACPFCKMLFAREDLEPKPPVLTLAHVIPESMGGRYSTLACAKCNNDIGTKLEARLLRQFCEEDSLAGVGASPGRLKGPFGEVGVEFGCSPENNAWSIKVIGKQSNPAALAALREQVDGFVANPAGGLDVNLAPSYKHYPRQVAAAIYQSALLVMFAHFGYCFLLHPHFAPLREQVAHPKSAILPTTFGTLSPATVEEHLSEHPFGVMIVRDPPCIQVCLRFRPKGGRERALAVMLPGLESPEVPAVRAGTVRGGWVEFCPEYCAETHEYLLEVWTETRRRAVAAG